MEIGDRIREERLRLGLTQEALGALIGATDRTVKKYEGNETSPRAVDLRRMEEAGADAYYILTGTRLPFGARSPLATYSTPASELAERIAAMKLSREDAEMLRSFADRLAG